MQSDQPKHILTIDLGTSGPKVALYTTLGELVADEFEPVQLYLLPNGGAEQSPQEWWQAIKQATHRLFSKISVMAADVQAVCCTSQWSGTVPVDRNGDPLMNAMIWMDSRGAPYIKQITSGLLKLSGYSVDKLFTWLKLTGGAPAQAGKDPIAHILFIKHQMPEIYRATYKFLEPKDYLNLKLTGQYAASYDSIALHWVTDNRDLSKVDYHERLLSWSTLDRDKLPELKRAVDILSPIQPQAALELGLPETVQVVMGTPDLQSAALGSGAVQDYDAHLYVGTSSWLACHLPIKKTDVLRGLAALPSAIPDKYLLTNEQETSGACYTFLTENLFFPPDELMGEGRPADVYETYEKMAARIPAGSEGLIFTPWLYGERTPVDDHYVRGGFFNLSLQSTRAHLIRSVLEGVAYNTRWLLGYVEKFVKHPLEAINIIGGGARSDLWCQIYADVLNRTIRRVVDPVQVNTRGAALLACLALRRLTLEQIAGRVQIERTFHPNPVNHLIYDRLFREFVEIYTRNRRAYARLNRGAV